MENNQNRCGLTPERLTDLVSRAKRGEQQAVTDLYNESYYEVYYAVQSMVKEPSTAQDVMQDAYIKAFGSLQKLENPTSFIPWLRRIAVNLASDHLRKQNPLLFSQLEDEDGNEPEFRDYNPTVDPADALDRAETARLVRGILDTLSPGERAAVSLFYYEQLPVREIARMLGSTENRVKVQLHNGRSKIKQRVEDYEKQGVKLYGLAPLPFFLYLLQQVRSFDAAEAAGLTTSASAAVGAAGAAESTAAAAETTGRAGSGFIGSAGRAGKAAAKTGFRAFLAAHKVGAIAAAAGAALIIGGVTTGVVLSDRSSGDTPRSAAQPDNSFTAALQSEVPFSSQEDLTPDTHEETSGRDELPYELRDEYPADAVLLYVQRTSNDGETPVEKEIYIYDDDQRLLQKVTYHWKKDSSYWLSGYCNYYYYAGNGQDGLLHYAQEYLFNADGTGKQANYTAYTYDEQGRIASRSESVIWSSTTEGTSDVYKYTYDSDGRLYQEEHSYMNMDSPHLTQYYYENGGNQPSRSRFLPGSLVGTPHETTYAYDENGNCVLELTQIYTNSNGLEDYEKVEYTYDEAGNKKSETHYEADFGDYIQPQPGQNTRWSIDKQKTKQWSYDSAGHEISCSFRYDAYNTWENRSFYGYPADYKTNRKLIMPYDNDHPVDDTLYNPSDYAEVVYDREQRWGFGAVGNSLDAPGNIQYYGVAFIRLEDLDCDGSDELILCYNLGGAEAFRTEIWTMNGSTPVMIYHEKVVPEEFWVYRLQFSYVNGKTYYAVESSGGVEGRFTVYGLENGAMNTIVSLEWGNFDSSTDIYYYVNGEETDLQTYVQMEDTYKQSRDYFPLLGNGDYYGDAMNANLEASRQTRTKLGLPPIEEAESN